MKTHKRIASQPTKNGRQRFMSLIAVIGLIVGSFVLSQVIMFSLLLALSATSIPTLGMSQNMFVIAAMVVTYAVMLTILFVLPRIAHSAVRIDAKLLGIHTSLRWQDIGLSIAGIVIYFMATTAVMYTAATFLPWIDLEQVQETGLTMTAQRSELFWIFILLVVVAPFVEELIFRGFAYGRIRESGVSIWLAATVSSVLFAAAHLQWNVALDTFVLGMVAAIAREVTGAIWTGLLVHMMKNGIAYYFLFISPISSIVGS